MAYVCVFNEHPVRKLQVGLSIVANEAPEVGPVLARAIVDTGAMASRVEDEWIAGKCGVLPTDFVYTQVPGRKTPDAVGFYDATVLVPEQPDPGVLSRRGAQLGQGGSSARRRVELHDSVGFVGWVAP